MKGAPKEIPGNYFPTGQFFLFALMMKGVNSPTSEAAGSPPTIGHEAQLYIQNRPNYHVSINVSLLKMAGWALWSLMFDIIVEKNLPVQFQNHFFLKREETGLTGCHHWCSTSLDHSWRLPALAALWPCFVLQWKNKHANCTQQS